MITPNRVRQLLMTGVCLLLFLFEERLAAQQVPTGPSSTHIFPAGGRRGSVVDVRVGGECIPPETRFRIFGEGVSANAVLGDRAAGNYAPSPRRKPSEQPVTHPTEWHSQIAISEDAQLGPAIWRLSCASGGTGGRPFIVGDLPEYIENEPNSVIDEAEVVSLPVTINGQIAGENDIDYFSFSASSGDVVTIDVVAGRLGSALDPVVELRDDLGQRVLAQQIRVGADPVLAFRAKRDGQHHLLISGVTYKGGPSYVYRVTISNKPFARAAIPAIGRTGTTERVDFLTIDGSSADSRNGLAIVAADVLFPQNKGSFVPNNIEIANAVVLNAVDEPSVRETAQNDRRETAMDVLWPATVHGQLESADDEDWYRISCTSPAALAIECLARPGESSAMPIVALIDGNGGVVNLVSAIQAVEGVSRIYWQSPGAGDWWIRVRDLQQGITGGPDFTYQLSVREAVPDFGLRSKSDVVNVLQGAKSEIEIFVDAKSGFSSPVELHVDGLPEGVSLEGQQIAAGQTTAKLIFSAAENAKSGDVTIRVRGTADVGTARLERVMRAGHLGRDADGVGVADANVDHLQLTVVHKPVFRLFCNEAYQYAHRGTLYPYLMEVERLGGFDQPIELQVADRQIKDLDGIEIPEMTVGSEQSKFMLPLYLPETMHINVQAHSNVYAQGHVRFVDQHGQAQTMLVISTMRCMIRTLPTVVKLRTSVASLNGMPDSTVSCPLVLDRTPNFSGAMEVQLVDPPQGITALPVTIPENESTGTLLIEVDSAVALSEIGPLKLRAVGEMDDSVRVISETTATIFISDSPSDSVNGE